jgi:hypothetical protein
MSRVITFSTKFPAKHPRAGEPTFFVEKIVRSLNQMQPPQDINSPFSEEMYYIVEPKHHTIRAGKRWKVGDKFSPRIWSGKPYASKQIAFANDIELVKVIDIEIEFSGNRIDVQKPTDKPNHYLLLPAGEVANNDGLDVHDFINWFAIHPKAKQEKFIGQILCWNDKVSY